MTSKISTSLIFRYCFWLILLYVAPASMLADETFVSIHQISGNRIYVEKESSASHQTRGMRSNVAAKDGNALSDSKIRPLDASVGRGPGQRQRGAASMPSLTMVTVPANVKITSAMRERRTFEFRVLGELPGGLRHPAFQNLREPLSARIVTKDNHIIEINVVTGDTDINQTATSREGETIIAVKPKRPPAKRRP